MRPGSASNSALVGNEGEAEEIEFGAGGEIAIKGSSDDTVRDRDVARRGRDARTLAGHAERQGTSPRDGRWVVFREGARRLDAPARG